MENLKRSRLVAGLDDVGQGGDHLDSDDSGSTDERSSQGSRPDTPTPKPGKKTRGRVRINMEFIDNKLRRYTTFSKRKSGIMKKAHELATLTGTQVMLLVASETGHVYTFATRKLQPILSSEAGKQLIQTCLNSPDPNDASSPHSHDDQRMSAQGFEEPELTYVPAEDNKDGLFQKTYHILNAAISAQHNERSPTPQHRPNLEPQPSSAISMATMSSSPDAHRNVTSSLAFPGSQPFALMTSQSTGTASPQLSHSQIHVSPPSSSPDPARMHLLQNTSVDRTACSSIPPPDGHRSAEEERFSILHPYNSLQRTVPGVQPLLVPGSLAIPGTQVALFGQNNKKQSR